MNRLFFKRSFSIFFSLLLVILCTVSPCLAVSAADHWPSGIEVMSNSAIVMDADTGTVLFEKNADEIHYPASITKLLTGLIAVENSEPDEIVTFSREAVAESYGGTSSIARDVGEKMTMEQCLYGMMLESANECAYAIGEHIGGDMDHFVSMMNTRARELGCTNTHFTNPNGLPDEEHVTTARDMAIIGRAVINNERIARIVGTKTYVIPPTNKHEDETYLNNHHSMLNYYHTSRYLYDGCLGGKTGYTVAANNTLVTFARRDNMTLVCCVMQADRPNHYEDTVNLFDYCFDNFQTLDIADNDGLFTNQKSKSVGSLARNMDMSTVHAVGTVIIPKTADFSDTQHEISPADEVTDGIIARLDYTYGDRIVGGGYLIYEPDELTPYPFHSEAEASGEEKTFRVDIRLILLIAGVVLVVIVLVTIIVKKSGEFVREKPRRKRDNDRPLIEQPQAPPAKHKTRTIYRRRRKRR
ncbi:MAG: D-alanyl-D-alanine carboxypeptidase [Lachnospiraceae bacterium]|nr:D-alanyl-D-alanine carboxypeptidase [Lachnospiraceae bacterium]